MFILQTLRDLYKEAHRDQASERRKGKIVATASLSLDSIELILDWMDVTTSEPQYESTIDWDSISASGKIVPRP